MEPNSRDEMLTVERLELMFRRPAELKANPDIVAQFLHAVSRDLPEEVQFQVLLRDPVLLLRFLTTQGGFDAHSGNRSFDTMTALLHVPNMAKRAFVSSTVVGGHVGLNCTSDILDTTRINRHALFVATLCRMYAEQTGTTRLTPEVLASVACLHELGVLVLARMNPETLRSLMVFAAQCGVSFDIGFMCKYPKSIHSLLGLTVSSWRLEAAPSKIWLAFEDATLDEELKTEQCCIRVADFIAHEVGYNWETWTVSNSLPDHVKGWYEQNLSLWEEIVPRAMAQCTPVRTQAIGKAA